MGFILDLVFLAGGLFGLVYFFVNPRATFWVIATLGAGYAGHADSGIVGTAIGLTLGGMAAGVVVLIWTGIWEMLKWTARGLKPDPKEASAPQQAAARNLKAEAFIAKYDPK